MLHCICIILPVFNWQKEKSVCCLQCKLRILPTNKKSFLSIQWISFEYHKPKIREIILTNNYHRHRKFIEQIHIANPKHGKTHYLGDWIITKWCKILSQYFLLSIAMQNQFESKCKLHFTLKWKYLYDPYSLTLTLCIGTVFDLNQLGPRRVNMYTQVHCMATKVDDDVRMSFLSLSP